jgi:ferredoxin
MPNPIEKNPGNAPGPFYVDSTCIDCDMCRELAPSSFRRNDEIGLSIVFHQPVSALEREQARHALTSCPTESIGDDGE